VKLDGKKKSDVSLVREALREEMLHIFGEVQNGSAGVEDVAQVLHFAGDLDFIPQVWLIVGVNGVGKTTTIGKLANAVARSGKKVVVAAGDTFRAAAGDQLKVWSERAQVEIFSPEGVSDPSAVAFDACQMAKARGFDVVIIDTAGRLHTQSNLMEELRKMKRVVQKVIPEAPHETLLVLDANSGQNALMQARNFHDILELSGVVLTKMDGTAKGGVAVGLACELELPIRLIGVGEGIDDLRPFKSEEFVDSII
ncbi:MAG: signal recognition particle-docking protein FtsY, partial [Bdellovibrionales bacterium]|nr:signal recognition particle-docking protein FtsY [Bdellovibrionales bacterium]